MEHMGEPGSIKRFAFLRCICGKITGKKFNPVFKAESGNGLFSERPGGFKIEHYSLKIRICHAEMNCKGAGSATHVEQPGASGQIYLFCHLRCRGHTDIEHPH